jgi:hypothetical protein
MGARTLNHPVDSRVLFEHQPSWKPSSEVIQLGFSYLKTGANGGRNRYSRAIAIALEWPEWSLVVDPGNGGKTLTLDVFTHMAGL